MVAISSGGAALFGLVDLTIPEGLLLSTLGLLALDALTERLSFLEKISNQLDGLLGRCGLRGRRDLVSPEDWAGSAENGLAPFPEAHAY